ncbi:apoptosis-antagonizing transcription factor [Lipomyces oligophaga]|uniref:apoptosis-antagonizing transcription factor n=1 Tax=Lipomyces oligophaga TaxID=45792 RepID=UPI0034CE2ABB
MTDPADESRKNGLAVKRQITIYERLLDCRIELQKALTSLNSITDQQHRNSRSVSNKGAIEEQNDLRVVLRNTREKTTELLDNLIRLRLRIIDANGQPSPELVSRKRKRERAEEDLSYYYFSAVELSASTKLYRTAVLEKWSQRVNAINNLGGAGSASGNKFSVLNQSVVNQVEDVLRDQDRLIARTRINRTSPSSESSKAPKFSKSSTGDEKINAGTVARISDSTLKQTHDWIFDDTDFYQILLKDLVDKNMSESSSAASGVNWTIRKPKVKRTDIDTKASKGRKLRYHVQEKIQNFMPPMPTPIISDGQIVNSSWTDDQIDNLFSRLFGQKIMDIVAE